MGGGEKPRGRVAWPVQAPPAGPGGVGDADGGAGGLQTGCGDGAKDGRSNLRHIGRGQAQFRCAAPQPLSVRLEEHRLAGSGEQGLEQAVA